MTNDDLEKLIEELQEKVEYNEEQAYSKIVIQEYRNPSNFGVLKNPDAIGKIKGPCGDTMEISVKVENDQIIKCTFDTDGCGASVACGSIVTEMAEGKLIRNARNITQKKILQFCGGLPEEDQHCALLAANTLQKAIDDLGS